MVKVLCISGSPRGEKSDSEKMLQLLINHIRKFGGEVELIRLADKNIMQCEGCYSTTRDGAKCTYPCIHQGKDDIGEILEKIISADSLAIATPIYWGTSSALVHRLIEKMTSLENNREEIEKKSGRDPMLGKPFALLCSQEAEGASMGLSHLTWALSGMGFMLLPWGMIFKPALLNRKLVRAGLRIIRERKFEWINNTIRLAARALVSVPRQLEGFSFDDHKVKEPRC
jgi:multimeric flavodoxin WrbA